MSEHPTSTPENPQDGVEYREVRDFLGYCVGNDGSAWSRKNSRWALLLKWKKLKLNLNTAGSGYLNVHLWKNNKVHVRGIHVLVLETFIGPCPEGMECCHNDGNSRNNHVGNLRWDTHANNARDTVLHGRTTAGSRHRCAKLTEKDIPEVLRMRREGFSLSQIAKRFGVTNCPIVNIIKGRAWRHVPREIPQDNGD